MSLEGSRSAPADDLASQIAALSPEKRRLLELRVAARSAAVAGEPIPRRQGGRHSPLSFEQERLWFVYQLDPRTPVYNVHRAWELRGPLNAGALDRALEAIVARHGVLRSTYEVVDGEPVQSTGQPGHRPLSIVDLRGLSSAERETRTARMALEESRRPFDLARGPILRLVLLRLADEHHVLLLALHHIVSDGWSLGILHRELSALYDAFAAGRPSPLDDLPIQFSDYAFWQRERWREGALEDRLAYWKRQLEGLPVLELPADRPRPRSVSFGGDREPLRLSAELTARLRSLGLEEDATLFVTLLAGFKALLHRSTLQEDIVIGTPMANRGRKELEPVVGMVVNTLVMRTHLGGDPTFRELIRRVRDMTLEAIAHQDVPFGKLVEALRPPRDIRRNPLFQVSFTLQNTPDPSPILTGLTTTPFMSGKTGLLPAGNGTSKFDLAASLIESAEGAHGVLEYSTDIFDRDTIERMARRFETLLARVAADPDERLSHFPLWKEIAPEARGAKSTGSASSPGRCVHELLEARAEQLPETVAVIFRDRRLTYGELNRRANQVARHLRKLGARPRCRVGIRVEPSPELVASVLGVLKAGAAYVPLDSARPGDDPTRIIEGGIELVLTDGSGERSGTEHRPRRVHVVRDWEVIARESHENIGSEVSAGDPACVLYGPPAGAGRPAGVEVEHRSVVDLLEAMSREPGMIASDALLSVATLSSVHAVLDLFLPLAAGAQLILAGREVATDGAALLELLRKTRATMMHATSATYRGMLASGWERRLPVRLLCEEEALSRELARELLARSHEVWSLRGDPMITGTPWSATRIRAPESARSE